MPSATPSASSSTPQRSASNVTPETRGAILRARTASTEGWTEDLTADLLGALTSLASRLKPVTAESLKAYHDDTRPTVHNYLIWAIILACVIIPVSVATFVTTAISTAIRDDITRANALAVKLRAELGPPPASGQTVDFPPKGISESDVIADLQEYASIVRVINARSRKLNHFVLPRQRLPFEDVATSEDTRKILRAPRRHPRSHRRPRQHHQHLSGRPLLRPNPPHRRSRLLRSHLRLASFPFSTLSSAPAPIFCAPSKTR